MIRVVILLSLSALFSGCASKSSVNDFRVSMGMVSAYKAANEEFKLGLVMEARARLFSIKQEDEDYAKAQSFLRKKVKPARLKLLRYYAKKGKKEERLKHWAKAEEAYKTAAELSIQPQALQRYQKKMNIKVRQVRMDAIYKQRKNEDETWLKWQRGYMPAKGLFGDDQAFVIARKNAASAFERRVEKTWSLVQKFKGMDMPEMTWLYADAYLRLAPHVKKAQDLKAAMAKAVPKGLRLPMLSKKKKKQTRRAKVSHVQMNVETVKTLMKQQKWLKAKTAAQTLRKQGNADADKLLEEIQAHIMKHAEKAYANGNLAFRSERIDQAVEFWQQAVDWMPDEQVYMDSLRRGKQMQERLGALKK